MSLFLSATELKELTGFTRKSSQVAALRLMNIKFILRGDGAALVHRQYIDTMCGAKENTKSANAPDWSALA